MDADQKQKLNEDRWNFKNDIDQGLIDVVKYYKFRHYGRICAIEICCWTIYVS